LNSRKLGRGLPTAAARKQQRRTCGITGGEGGKESASEEHFCRFIGNRTKEEADCRRGEDKGIKSTGDWELGGRLPFAEETQDFE
jgi:hypothetical protein